MHEHARLDLPACDSKRWSLLCSAVSDRHEGAGCRAGRCPKGSGGAEQPAGGGAGHR